VFVGPGVNIRCGAVIGVRSTVLRDVQPGHIAYGSPATSRGLRTKQSVP
jgi:acetyltransferase-like isoleucine patch superfamily enzyme